jgi:RNA polymerase sigma-70 factor, ECF subfamily
MTQGRGDRQVVTDANVLTNGVVAEPSSSLLHRVQSYDPAAWERLVNLYTPLVFRWCRRCGLQPADAADVGQQVFLAVARKVRDFRRNRPGGSFRAWLRAIARNRLRDFFRTARTRDARAAGGDAFAWLEQVAAGPDPSDPTPEDGEEEALLFRRATELMQAEFEERTWQAFWQSAVDGRRAAEVAAGLGMTANAVYLARGRVLRRLREEFADLVGL